MKTFPRLFCWGGQLLIALLLSGCAGSTADNKDLDYDQLDVNFEAVVQGESLTTDEVVAVFATCTRGEETDLKMSQNSPAKFMPVSAGQTVNLVKKTDDDNILSYVGDHNFKFSAFLPFSAYDGDVTKLKADIPAVVTYGNMPKALQVAKAAKTSVVAPVELAFSSMSCHMVMNIPGNILGGATLPVLSSLEIKAYDESVFDGYLAFNATYDLTADNLNVVSSSLSKTLKVDFGTSGLPLKVGYNAVAFNVAPFTVPVDGFLVEVKDVDGNTVVSEVLMNDAGTEYKAGETIEINLTRPGEDGIIPCESPVEWP